MRPLPIAANGPSAGTAQSGSALQPMTHSAEYVERCWFRVRRFVLQDDQLVVESSWRAPLVPARRQVIPLASLDWQIGTRNRCDHRPMLTGLVLGWAVVLSVLWSLDYGTTLPASAYYTAASLSCATAALALWSTRNRVCATVFDRERQPVVWFHDESGTDETHLKFLVFLAKAIDDAGRVTKDE